MGYVDALSVLKLCSTDNGLKASGRKVGHHQVWARDSMITLLGARFAADEQVQTAVRASVELLRANQSISGAIPNNVDCATMRPNFRAYADAGLWWIIGSSLVAPDGPATSAILRWYACQDVDQTGLLSMQESADWQDLFCTRGKGLYLNCLYVLALRAAGELERARQAAEAINRYFWYRGDGDLLPHISHTFSTESREQQDSLGRKRWLPEKKSLVTEQYYLPYLGFRAVGEWFDSLGNLLAILSGVADESQDQRHSGFHRTLRNGRGAHAQSHAGGTAGRSRLAGLLRHAQRPASLSQRGSVAVHWRILCCCAGPGREDRRGCARVRQIDGTQPDG